MENWVEKLPIEVNGHWLRIKARPNGKKWCIRYIRKVSKDKDNPKYKSDWKYRTEIQCYGNNLELTAKRMIKQLVKHIK